MQTIPAPWLQEAQGVSIFHAFRWNICSHFEVSESSEQTALIPNSRIPGPSFALRPRRYEWTVRSGTSTASTIIYQSSEGGLFNFARAVTNGSRTSVPILGSTQATSLASTGGSFHRKSGVKWCQLNTFEPLSITPIW